MRNMIKKIAPAPARKLYIVLRKRIILAEFAIFHRLPIRKKRVVFCNVWGFGDNPKWIAKALRNSDKSLEIIFITDKATAERVPKGIKIVQTNTPRAIKYLATAHIWVDCNRKEPYIVKRSGQIYIQTWHGSIPLKKLEADYDGLSAKYMENAYRDSRMTDLCLSNGEFMNDIYRKAFGYECEIAVTGSARIDPLLRPKADRVIKTKKRIASLAGVQDSRNVKIAVYAPTYRENGEKVDFPDLSLVKETLEKRFGSEFILVSRVHPLVRPSGAIEKISTTGKLYAGGIIDGNGFGDMYELLEASDVLITDYSNTLFEFGLTGKPVFLYAADSKKYSEERGFYFDYEGLPYPHAATTEELCECIEDYSEFDHKKDLSDFFGNLGIREDGKASRRIAEMILRKVYRS